MFQTVENRVREAFRSHIGAKYNLDAVVVVEEPNHASFGELALPVAFQLARGLKKAPKAIAADLLADLPAIPGVASLEVAGNGYINIRLDRGAYAAAVLASGGSSSAEAKPGKIIVEHTNINPNKAAHIGHLRNAVLGDTFVRMLRATGNQVEVQNYIDNTGVQVADVVVGFHHLEKQTIADARKLIETPERPFDYVCWDLYARTSAYYDTHPEAKQWRADTLHAELGKWLSRDPIAEEGGMNLYGYVDNSPITYWDAYGLEIYVAGVPSFGPFGAHAFAYSTKTKSGRGMRRP